MNKTDLAVKVKGEETPIQLVLDKEDILYIQSELYALLLSLNEENTYREKNSNRLETLRFARLESLYLKMEGYLQAQLLK